MLIRIFANVTRLSIVITIITSLLLTLISPACVQAFADENSARDTMQNAYDEYSERKSELEKIDAEIKENEEELNELEKTLPGSREEAAKSAKRLYENYDDLDSISILLTSSDNVSDMLMLADFFYRSYEKDEKTVIALSEKESKLNKEKTALSEKRTEAQKKTDEANSAYEKAKEAAGKVREASTRMSGSSVDTSMIDWSDESEFVSEWGKRIDAYLAGSPTAGTGKYYAQSAWDHVVDPRLAPAISLMESNKGRNMGEPFNAWGYNGGYGINCSSWQEAIEKQVSNLGRSLYGGVMNQSTARIYCPPNSSRWLATVSAEMLKI